ncbi:MAG TPA: hypothetical protein VGL39_08985 [Jatrophihabitantaceae bacterium]|jgi:hypothetical protein
MSLSNWGAPVAGPLLACSIALAGCASSSPSGGSTSPATPSSSPTSAGSSPTAAVLLLDRDDGRSVSVSVGTRVTVRLASTYWLFAPASGPVLHQDGTVVARPLPPGSGRCVPGAGCGTVTLAFDAVRSGQGAIVATRRSCGEAMACTGGQGRYEVTIVVR